MVYKSIWIGIGAFILAMLATPNIDPSNRETVLNGLSFAGSAALARDRDMRSRRPIIDLDLDVDDDDGGDDDDDDGGDDD